MLRNGAVMRTKLAHRKDKTHFVVRDAIKNRCGGYWRDADYPLFHYANLQGLRVVAYDFHKIGGGVPDWLVFVGTFAIYFEVKAEREERKDTRGRKRVLNDKEYYFAQLEPAEKFFYAHHPSITAIVWDQNQVYDWLVLCANYVNLQEAKFDKSKEFLELFFPKLKEQEILINNEKQAT